MQRRVHTWLCAGIGALAFADCHRDPFRKPGDLEIVCVEINPDYTGGWQKSVAGSEMDCCKTFSTYQPISVLSIALLRIRRSASALLVNEALQLASY